MSRLGLEKAMETLSENVRSQKGFYENTRVGNDNLVYCTKCGVCRQHFDTFLNRYVYCTCKCQQDKFKAESERRKSAEEQRRIRQLRFDSGIDDKAEWNFLNDDGGNPKLMNRLKIYAEKWQEISEKNIGLLLFGGTGTGKTFAAYCVANALISKGVSVKATNFSSIINALESGEIRDKNAYIYELKNVDFLLIDDLGAERQTDYALQIIEHVIDERYKAGKPLAITTNLKNEELKNPRDTRYKRVYSRILGMTASILVDGKDRRTDDAKNKARQFNEIICLEDFEEVV